MICRIWGGSGDSEEIRDGTDGEECAFEGWAIGVDSLKADAGCELSVSDRKNEKGCIDVWSQG